MKKTLFLVLIAAVAVGGGAFYGGIKYAQGKAQGSLQNFSNLSPEARQQRLQQMGANAGAGFRGGSSGNSGFVAGEIISKDEKSVNIKIRDGGSKIIFYSDTTEINKSAAGTSEDLETGKTVTISGKTNQDGSITAQSIEVRPIAALNQ